MKRRPLITGLLLSSLGCVSIVLAEPNTESAKIDRLIQKIRELEGAVFIRNGTEHSAQEAAEHLQLKRSKAGKRLQTAEDFIRYCATKSSLSGEPYLIRFKDGHSEPAAEFLRNYLKTL